MGRLLTHSAHTIGLGTSLSRTSSLVVPTATADFFSRPPAHLEKRLRGTGWDGAPTSFGEGGVGSSKQKPGLEQHPWGGVLSLGRLVSHFPVLLSLGTDSYESTPLWLTFLLINPNFFPSLLHEFVIYRLLHCEVKDLAYILDFLVFDINPHFQCSSWHQDHGTFHVFLPFSPLSGTLALYFILCQF